MNLEKKRRLKFPQQEIFKKLQTSIKKTEYFCRPLRKK